MTKIFRSNNTNILIRSFSDEQVQYFPNRQRKIDFWIITTSEILHGVIIDDKLTTL